MLIALLIIIVILLLATGMEIGIAIGLSGVMLLLIYENIPMSVVAEKLFSGLNSYSLLAIPFFILAGNVMMEGKLADRLLGFFGAFTRKVTGGLGIGAMLSAVFFASISGSSVASAAAMGKSLTELLSRENYSKHFIAGVLAVGGTLGLMIPPSLTFILIGTMQGIPVRDLFLAGVIPGLLEGFLLILMTYFISKRKNYGFKGEIRFAEIKTGFNRSAAALLMPVLILGGIYLGIFTPTEVSIVSVVYAILIGLFIYKTLNWRAVPVILKDSIHSTAMIFLVLMGGSLLGFILTRLGVADTLLTFIKDINLSNWGFLLLVNIILLILGCFLDGISLIVILTPILFPIAQGLGIHPIHMAVIMTANVEIATITPPVGLNLFVVSGVSKLPIHEVVKGVAPFYAIRLIGLLLITYIPYLSLALL